MPHGRCRLATRARVAGSACALFGAERAQSRVDAVQRSVQDACARTQRTSGAAEARLLSCGNAAPRACEALSNAVRVAAGVVRPALGVWGNTQSGRAAACHRVAGHATCGFRSPRTRLKALKQRARLLAQRPVGGGERRTGSLIEVHVYARDAACQRTQLSAGQRSARTAACREVCLQARVGGGHDGGANVVRRHAKEVREPTTACTRAYHRVHYIAQLQLRP